MPPFDREPDTDYEIHYEPVPDNARAIVRTIDGVFTMEIGEVLE